MQTWVKVDGLPARPWVILVTSATHDLVLAHPEYQPVRRKVSIVAGETLQIRLSVHQDFVPRQP